MFHVFQRGIIIVSCKYLSGITMTYKVGHICSPHMLHIMLLMKKQMERYPNPNSVVNGSSYQRLPTMQIFIPPMLQTCLMSARV